MDLTPKKHKKLIHMLKRNPSELKKIDEKGTIIHKILTNKNYYYITLIQLIKMFPEGLFIKDDFGRLPIHCLVTLDFEIDIECILKLMLKINPEINPDTEGNYPLHIYLKRINRQSDYSIEVIEMLSTKQALTSYNRHKELPIHIISKANHLNDYWVKQILTVLIDNCPETLLMQSKDKYPVELISTMNCNSAVQCLRVRLPQEIIHRIIKNIWEHNFADPVRNCIYGTAILLFKLDNKLVKELYIDDDYNSKILDIYDTLISKHNILGKTLDSECCLEELGIIKEAIDFAIKPDVLSKLI
jgi:hypothetical protein